jgi:D-alanyl-lipoteichoic acid acyltransferase DltB (MBOAT superfamily)
MLFNSLSFLAFSAVYFSIHFLLRGNARLTWLLVASYFFYGWWDWRFLPLIAGSTAFNFIAGWLISVRSGGRTRRGILMATIAVNLIVLGIFKYYDFFVDSLQAALATLHVSASPYLLRIALPVGISFYTFHNLSYVIDVYRGSCSAERNPIRFAAYIALFPQLVAGPIVRAARLLPQLRIDPKPEWPRIAQALQLIAIGFTLKLVVADNLAPFVDARFADPAGSGGAALSLATLFFAFQIYGDFAGYSLIAIGLGRIMGYDFGENFRRPYLSASFSEFWQRWHISLSSWLRDYLYIPLGGNQGGAAKTARNLIIVMFLGGLWHGANWTFVVWGLLHGSFLVIQRMLSPLASVLSFGRITTVMQVALVFAMVCLAWIFFRAATIDDAWMIVTKIVTLDGGAAGLSGERLTVLRNLMLVGALVAVEVVAELRPHAPGQAPAVPGLRHAAVLLVLLWTIAAFGAFAGSQFVYFQF